MEFQAGWNMVLTEQMNDRYYPAALREGPETFLLSHLVRVSLEKSKCINNRKTSGENKQRNTDTHIETHRHRDSDTDTKIQRIHRNTRHRERHTQTETQINSGTYKDMQRYRGIHRNIDT